MSLFLQSNLEILARRQPELVKLIEMTGSSQLEVFQSSSGAATARFNRQGLAPIALHSRYDPVKESRKSLKRFNIEGSDYFILLGFGLGYTLDALLEHVNGQDCSFFIVESELQILRAAFESRDLTRMLELPRLHIAWPSSGPELAEQWSRFFDPVSAQNSVYITHAPSLELNPQLFKSAAELIQSQIFQLYTDINTLIGTTKTFLENFAENLPAALASPGVSQFTGRFAGIPAVIVSAGPSLDKNIHELCGREANVLILSTDTAVKPLLAAGVEPHFILTGDPSVTNFGHLRGVRLVDALVVAEATAYPRVFSEFSYRTVTCTYQGSSLRSITEFLAEKGQLRAWGSVATMALDFALILGCDPIIFMGQDLAHSDGRIYCSGVYFEEEWFQGVTSPGEWERRLRELRSYRKTVQMTDIFGNVVETTDKLAAYWNWITKEIAGHPDIRFINATEGGILRDEVAIMSLRETLYRYCAETRNLKGIIRESFGLAGPGGLESANCILLQWKSESLKVREILDQGKAHCCEGAALSSVELLSQLDAIKDQVYSAQRVAPLLDTLNQMGNITFLRRRRKFRNGPVADGFLSDIISAYSDLFDSMGQALSVLENGLAGIESSLQCVP